MRGLFITVEGMDGTGKTTQIELLSKYLKGKGYAILVTQEPGGTRIGKQIRDILKDKINTELLPLTEMLLFMSARYQHLQEVVSPALQEGEVVISSRYIDSTYAYQGYGEGLSLMHIQRVEEMVIEDGLYPDLTIILDLPSKIAMRRIKRDKDRIESKGEEFYDRVRMGFHTIAKMDHRCKIVDARGKVEDVHRKIKEIIDQFLNCKKENIKYEIKDQ